jgi:hypothetical protein
VNAKDEMAQAFSNVALAFAGEYQNRMADKAKSNAVRAAMPKRHPRDSYWTWAKLCREYSGASFLDSGGAYGRQHSAPSAGPDVDPITVHICDGNLEYASINLAHFLYHFLDASDENARAVQDMIEWWGEWIMLWPSWEETLNDLFDVKNIRMLSGAVVEQKNRSIVDRRGLREAISMWAISGDIGFPPGQAIDDDEAETYAAEAVKALKSRSLLRLVELEPVITGSRYTYNYRNDLDQDFVYYAIATNEDPLLVVQTHNGCDARSGFSSPLTGGSKSFDTTADEVPFYVNIDIMTETDIYDAYSYDRAIQKGDLAEKWGGPGWLEKLQCTIQVIRTMQSGQGVLDASLEPAWPYPFSIEIGLQLVEIMVPDEDGELPEVPIIGEFQDGGWVRLARPGETIELPGESVALLDPETGDWSARIYHEIYNF